MDRKQLVLDFLINELAVIEDDEFNQATEAARNELRALIEEFKSGISFVGTWSPEIAKAAADEYVFVSYDMEGVKGDSLRILDMARLDSEKGEWQDADHYDIPAPKYYLLEPPAPPGDAPLKLRDSGEVTSNPLSPEMGDIVFYTYQDVITGERVRVAAMIIEVLKAGHVHLCFFSSPSTKSKPCNEENGIPYSELPKLGYWSHR